ncbi:MAG: DUF4417 domain-containing protein [Bacilli bacterium]|nr:DUF4417 domain-containing protein [Bacilli bacterium]
MNIRVNYPRKSDKVIFLFHKLDKANFNTGFYQVPAIEKITIEKPDELILWSRRNKCLNKKKCGLVFYEFDNLFDGCTGIYMTLKYGSSKEIARLISELKQFMFVVCPDYSVYGNFPNYKQIDALSRSREVGYILSTYGIPVVVNYRATYKWTYELALSGMKKHQIVAIGTLGALQDKESRRLLKDSVDALVQTIEPCVIIVYGKAPEYIFREALRKNIGIWQFDSMISKAFDRSRSDGNEG